MFSSCALAPRLMCLACTQYLPHFAETHEDMFIFVPKTKPERVETGKESNGCYRPEERDFFLTLAQRIIRYSRAEMVDVMKADVAAEPPEDFRKPIERTSLEGRIEEAPLMMSRPIDSPVLMLNVEKPKAGSAGNPYRRQEDENQWNESDTITDDGDDQRQRNIRPQHALSLSGSGIAGRETVRNQKHEERSDHKHHQRVSVETIDEAAPARPFKIFLHRQHPYIADSAIVQVASGGMMDRVIVPPLIIGSERKESAQHSDNIVRLLRFEERTVAAIVENDERSHQKAGRRNGEGQRKPVGDG